MTYFAFIIGTAGSGKTALTTAFREYLQQIDLDVIAVNLDPGVRVVPYSTEIDVRDWIDYEKVMLDYELGPNAALVASTDLIGTRVFDIKKEIDDFNADIVLVDTPGQMELFAFRETGPIIVNDLSSEKSALIFLIDPFLSKDPSGYISVLFLSLSVQCRFNIPNLHVLSKSDLLLDEDIDRIISWGESPELLITALEEGTKGLLRITSEELLSVIENVYTAYAQPIPVSNKTWEGLDILYGELSRIWSGGIDYITDE